MGHTPRHPDARGITIAQMRVPPMSLALNTAPIHSPVIVAGARRKNAALPQRTAARTGMGDGALACMQAWERVRALSPDIWLALPAVRGGAWCDPAFLLQGVTAAGMPHPALAAEVERALARGSSATTAPCLVALAALAHARHAGGEAALALAEAALRMLPHPDDPQAALVHGLYAALLLPAVEGLPRAAAALAMPGEDKPLAPLPALWLAGAGFAAGMPLAALSRQLAAACKAAGATDDAARRELGSRARLLDGLLGNGGAAPGAPFFGKDQSGEEARFGHWLTRLQAAWYAGEQACALAAVHAAGALCGPLTAPGDLLLYHLFAALALSRSETGAALPALRRHCEALRGLDARCKASSGALPALAEAAYARRRGDALGALRGCEEALGSATRQGLHWLAALAGEEAAWQAAACGLASAARHYRQQALASCRNWGALGRLAYLRSAWRDDAPASSGGAAPARLACAFGQSLAHELNQPLAAVTLHAAAAGKWLRRAEPDVERALASLALIGAAGSQAGEIVRGMQRLASGQTVETTSVDLDDAVREALQMLEPALRKQGIALELALGLGACGIEANRGQLQQVLTNLVLNAIEAHAACSALGTRRIRIATCRAGADEVELAVTDNGPGIAPAYRDRVFASPFSTKRAPASSGAGMGLAISLDIVLAHGGRIRHEPCAPHGACFRVRLPLRGKQQPA